MSVTMALTGHHNSYSLGRMSLERKTVGKIVYNLTESIRRVEELTGKKVTAYTVDLLDSDGLSNVFRKVMQ